MIQGKALPTKIDVIPILEQAIARVEMAHTEGDSILKAWLPDAKAAVDQLKKMRNELNLAECGCEAEATDVGVMYVECPKHGATDDLLEIVVNLHKHFEHCWYGPIPTDPYRDPYSCPTDYEGKIRWKDHVAEVLKKAGVA